MLRFPLWRVRGMAYACAVPPDCPQSVGVCFDELASMELALMGRIRALLGCLCQLLFSIC